LNLKKDLETLLNENGVPEQHISKLKRQYQYDIFVLDKYYESKKIEKVIQSVPVNKIKATSRQGLPNDSWFDLAQNASKVIYKDNCEIRSNIDASKVEEALDYLLSAENLSVYHQSLVDDIQEVDLNYYDKDDIYAVESDGNHRTILAKLTNAPFIKARVSTLNFSQEKYERGLKIKDSVKEFDVVLDKLNLTSDCDNIYYHGKPVIGAFVNGLFKYYFKCKEDNVSSLLSSEDEIKAFLNRLIEVTNYLYQIYNIKERYQHFYTCMNWLNIWKAKKFILYLYHSIKCFNKNSLNLKFNKLAFSMILEDLKLDYSLFDTDEYIVL